MTKEPVLVLAPHTDDGELGCGATIARFREEATEVHYLALSACEESVPPEFDPDVLRREVIAATAELNIPQENVKVMSFRVRRFPEQRQEILEELVRVNRRLQPQLVFAPSSFDVHQDHGVIFQEARRAFKTVSILGYEFMWNNFSFNSNLFSVVEPGHVERKIAAVAHYKSQAHRFYGSDELIRGLARFRGLQVKREYAEAFEVIRWIL